MRRRAKGEQEDPEGKRIDNQELILFLNVLIKSNTMWGLLYKKKK